MTATVRVVGKQDNIAGVKIPVFKQLDLPSSDSTHVGLAGGGRAIAASREKCVCVR